MLIAGKKRDFLTFANSEASCGSSPSIKRAN